KSGEGGKGCRSFYRDKYTRKGIPDGGDGGKGADIIVRADKKLYTLLDYKYKRHFYAKHGGHGSGNNKKGRDAEDIVIRVPLGTVVRDIRANCVLRDLTTDQQEIVVVCGGKGGNGNQHHKEAIPGAPGVEKELLLDLKIIAEVGVVGFPNAGKSTLICSISNAHSKVAGYHFTTKSPVLGVVKSQGKVFVAADMPGLIEGASAGRGLGDKFLRHIERTKILVHLLDISGCEGRDPLQDYRILNKELENYSRDVAKKPQVIAANKMDLEGAEKNLSRLRRQIKKKVYPVSALQKQGLEELVEAVAKKI
ncbi:MAG: GTPase ObgE, partial [Candidatus Omnitrophota bacterium]|nr:GTPase ObgE [Candidatus Omnitrophota bacterium]